MIPHERSLVERMQGKPFALLGVNSDDKETPQRLASLLKENQVNWRSFKNKLPGTRTIAKEWGVRGYPTLILIDHNGVIQKIWAGKPDDAELDRVVNQYVEAAGKAS